MQAPPVCACVGTVKLSDLSDCLWSTCNSRSSISKFLRYKFVFWNFSSTSCVFFSDFSFNSISLSVGVHADPPSTSPWARVCRRSVWTSSSMLGIRKLNQFLVQLIPTNSFIQILKIPLVKIFYFLHSLPELSFSATRNSGKSAVTPKTNLTP